MRQLSQRYDDCEPGIRGPGIESRLIEGGFNLSEEYNGGSK